MIRKLSARTKINGYHVLRYLKPRKVASLVHKGPYETIGPEYCKILTFVSQESVEYKGPMMNVYLNDPNRVSPEDIMAETRIPVK